MDKLFEEYFPSPPHFGSGEQGFPPPSYFFVRRRLSIPSLLWFRRAGFPNPLLVFCSEDIFDPPLFRFRRAGFSNPLLFFVRMHFSDEVSGKEDNFDGQAGKLQEMRVGLRPHTPSKAPFPVAG